MIAREPLKRDPNAGRKPERAVLRNPGARGGRVPAIAILAPALERRTVGLRELLSGESLLRLIVSKEGASTSVDRTTLANGFSEDIDLDIPLLERSLRFAMEGFWGIEAADMTRLSLVKDLLVFFMYELPEGAGDE